MIYVVLAVVLLLSYLAACALVAALPWVIGAAVLVVMFFLLAAYVA